MTKREIAVKEGSATAFGMTEATRKRPGLQAAPGTRCRFGSGEGQRGSDTRDHVRTRRCKRRQRLQQPWLRLQQQAVHICRLHIRPTGEKRTDFTATSPPGSTDEHTPTHTRHKHRHTHGKRMFQTASVYMLLPQCKSKLHPAQGLAVQFVAVTKINHLGRTCSQI